VERSDPVLPAANRYVVITLFDVTKVMLSDKASVQW